ncbi:MAG: DinB family protein [Gemmatimonadetes bacterium]|nr:DinB family protein [Gemmatimonadota bacterium]
MSARPAAGDFPEGYSAYVGRVPDGDVGGTLTTQLDDTAALLSGLSEADALRRYAEGKWSVKEVLGHIADTERVFSYRLLRFSRGDSTALPGFDENEYTPAGRFDDRDLADLLAELRAVRAATVALIHGLPPESLHRRGTASGGSFTVAAIPWIIAGHELHHRQILRERYLGSR